MPAVFAQETPTPSVTAAPAKIDEPVIEPSPFEVKAEKDEGYMARNTTSGSRLNTSLKDTAAPISVFTQEFLADIGATDVASLADYTVNTERLNGIVGDVANGNEFSGPAADLRVRDLASARMANSSPAAARWTSSTPSASSSPAAPTPCSSAWAAPAASSTRAPRRPT